MRFIFRYASLGAVFGIIALHQLPSGFAAHALPTFSAAQRILSQSKDIEHVEDREHIGISPTIKFQPFGNLKLFPPGQRFEEIRARAGSSKSKLAKETNRDDTKSDLAKNIPQLQKFAKNFNQLESLVANLSP